jgi:hypothetical protein
MFVRFLIALSLCACSFEARSGEYACPNGDECDSSRTCVNGFCVLTTVQPTVDAQRPIDARPFVCPAGCDYCEGVTCVLECSGDSSCASGVQCPPDELCRIECSGADSCAGSVSCGNASSCTVQCTGINACAEGVECGTGLCNVTCRGAGTCGAAVDCQNSCACDVLCENGGCAQQSLCPGNNACVDGDGCTSKPGSCHSC